MKLDILRMQLARIMSLLYKGDLTESLLKTIQKIYSHYRWIISKINPKNEQFTIPDVEELRQVQEKLLPLIDKVTPMFYLPEPILVIYKHIKLIVLVIMWVILV
jgi:hypothetical protein